MRLAFKILIVYPVVSLFIGLVVFSVEFSGEILDIVNNKDRDEFIINSDIIEKIINDLNGQLTEKQNILDKALSDRYNLNESLNSVNNNINIIESKLRRLNKPKWWEYIVLYVKSNKISKRKQKKIDELNKSLDVSKAQSSGMLSELSLLNDNVDNANQDIINLNENVLLEQKRVERLTINLIKIEDEGKIAVLLQLYKSNQLSIILYSLLAYLSFYLAIPIKAFKYWLLSPYAESLKSIKLVERVQGKLLASESSDELAVKIENKPLLIKPDWYHQMNEGKVNSILIFSWGSFFASYALGLVNLVRFYPNGKNDFSILLSNKKNENTVIMEIALQNHCGLAVRRNHVIALSEGLKIKTIYKFANLSSWVFGRFKYYLITGTGSVYIYGIQGIDHATSSSDDNSFIQDHLLAFDASDEFSLKRRPPFIPYLKGDQALFDIRFNKGSSVFRQKVIKSSNPHFFRSFLDDALKVFDVISGRA